MARGKSDQNAAILEYALHHLERERDEIQAKIEHIRRQLGGRAVNSSSTSAAPSASSEPSKKRVLSEVGAKAHRRRAEAPMGRTSQSQGKRGVSSSGIRRTTDLRRYGFYHSKRRAISAIGPRAAILPASKNTASAASLTAKPVS